MAITAYQILVFIIRQDLYKKIPEIQGERLMKVVKKEKWICKMASYQEQSGVKVPISDQAISRLENGYQVYNKFEVLKIKYIF